MKQKMAQIIGFNPLQLSQEDWISNWKKNPGRLMLLVNGLHELILLHQVSFLQENVFCPDSKFLGWRDLKAVTSAEDVASLIVPDQNPSVFCRKTSLVIPPLGLTLILEANTLCPATLIPLLSSKFQEFDRTSTQVKSCTSLCPVLEFLCAMYRTLVPPTVVTLDSSTDGLEWSS